MKKKYQILGFIILLICSIVYDFQEPEHESVQQVELSYVILEGEFLKTGEFEFEGQKTVKDIVDEVGITEKANLDALSMNNLVQDETRLYLPMYQDDCVSLNKASKTELMTLKGIGEKTAEKIIEYRNQTPFTCIEDIMNISGIGEKTYLRLRDRLCL